MRGIGRGGDGVAPRLGIHTRTDAGRKGGAVGYRDSSRTLRAFGDTSEIAVTAAHIDCSPPVAFDGVGDGATGDAAFDARVDTNLTSRRSKATDGRSVLEMIHDGILEQVAVVLCRRGEDGPGRGWRNQVQHRHCYVSFCLV